MMILLLSTALAGGLPSDRVESAQKTGWSGMGLSVAGSSLVWTGSLVYYDSFLEAVTLTTEGRRDPQKADPQTAMRSGLLVSGGLGISAIGRPMHSFGSALAAQWYRADGGDVSTSLGWTSVGLWATGTGVFLVGDSARMDQAWLGLRVASWGTGLSQLILTQRAINRAEPHAEAAWDGRATLEVDLGPNYAGLSGRF